MDLLAEARRHWEQRWGSDPAPSMAAVTSIMRAQQLLMARLNELLAKHDLTFPRYEALMLLSFTRSGTLPLGKIGDRLQVHRTSVTNVVDRLEASGYVRRVPHPGDRRTVLAELTPAGREVARVATRTLNDARFGLDGVPAEELEQLIAVLSRVRARAGDHVENLYLTS